MTASLLNDCCGVLHDIYKRSMKGQNISRSKKEPSPKSPDFKGSQYKCLCGIELLTVYRLLKEVPKKANFNEGALLWEQLNEATAMSANGVCQGNKLWWLGRSLATVSILCNCTTARAIPEPVFCWKHFARELVAILPASTGVWEVLCCVTLIVSSPSVMAWSMHSFGSKMSTKSTVIT